MLLAEMSLDVLDRQLITVLKEDGRMSYTDLAQRLGVTEGTARNRLQRMIGSDTLRIVPIVDQTQIGYRLNVWIGIRCRPGTFREVARGLARLDSVRYVGSCTGAYSVIVEAIFLSQEELGDFLAQELPEVDGIVSTETSVVFSIDKLGYEWELRESDVTPVQNPTNGGDK